MIARSISEPTPSFRVPNTAAIGAFFQQFGVTIPAPQRGRITCQIKRLLRGFPQLTAAFARSVCVSVVRMAL
jgi:hypothetical protein